MKPDTGYLRKTPLRLYGATVVRPNLTVTFPRSKEAIHREIDRHKPGSKEYWLAVMELADNREPPSEPTIIGENILAARMLFTKQHGRPPTKIYLSPKNHSKLRAWTNAIGFNLYDCHRAKEQIYGMEVIVDRANKDRFECSF